MKLYLSILLFFLLLLSLISFKSSYSYEDCHNYSIYPKEINTLNLEDYIGSKEIISFCSYNRCFKVKGKLKDSITNFTKKYNSLISEEEYNIVYVKGYPITKIIINNCK